MTTKVSKASHASASRVICRFGQRANSRSSASVSGTIRKRHAAQVCPKSLWQRLKPSRSRHPFSVHVEKIAYLRAQRTGYMHVQRPWTRMSPFQAINPDHGAFEMRPGPIWYMNPDYWAPSHRRKEKGRKEKGRKEKGRKEKGQ